MRLVTIARDVHRLENIRGDHNEILTPGDDFTASLPRGTTTMITRIFAPALLAAAAAAVIWAPAAGAASTAECDDDGPASVCTRNGHAAIFAEPRQSGGPNLFMAPGGGPMPPMLAMD